MRDADLAELYRRLEGLVRARLITKYPSIPYGDREEYAADIVLKLIRSLGDYDETKGTVATWALRSVHTFVIDKAKKRKEEELPDKISDSAQAASPHSITPDVTYVMSAYIPFRTPMEAMHRLAALWLTHQGRLGVGETRSAIAKQVQQILQEHNVAWERFGAIQDVTVFLFALIRMAMSRDGDKERVKEALAYAGTATTLGLLRQVLGTEHTARLLLLFGGETLYLPPVAVLTALGGKKSKATAGHRKRLPLY